MCGSDRVRRSFVKHAPRITPGARLASPRAPSWTSRPAPPAQRLPFFGAGAAGRGATVSTTVHAPGTAASTWARIWLTSPTTITTASLRPSLATSALTVAAVGAVRSSRA